MRWKRSELIVGLCALLIAFDASATVRRLAINTDAASNAEGEIELEGWLDFGKPASNGHLRKTSVTNGMFWLGARFGLLDNLELASFLVLEKKSFVELQPEPPADPLEIRPLAEEQSGIMMWVSELRWRPAEVGKWPVDLFLQFQLVHWFELYHPTQFRFTLGLSKNVGRFLLVANVSYWDSVVGPALDGNPKGIRWAWWEISLGTSVNLIEADGSIPSVNAGVEVWGFLPRKLGDGRFHVHNHLLHGGGLVVGPTLSLARGRLWINGHLGFPVFVPSDDPGQKRLGPGLPLVGRVMLGINL